MCLLDKAELVKFWKSSALDPGPAILKDSSTLQDRTSFHILAHVSGKTDRMFMKILPECIRASSGRLKTVSKHTEDNAVLFEPTGHDLTLS